MAGLQSGDDGMMIDSVVWAQYVDVTDIATQSRRHSNRRANALRQAAKTVKGKSVDTRYSASW